MLTRTEIDQIIRMNNLILRNLRITQAYYELSQGMAQVLGGENVNWCSFATYASKTAGYAIRHDRLPDKLALAFEWMDGSFDRLRAGHADTRTRLHSYLTDPAHRLTVDHEGLVESILDCISLSVSIGNGRVFAELAHPFHRFITELGQDAAYDENHLQYFLAQFRPGPVAGNGQDYLIEAFTTYYRARFMEDSAQKAQAILLANLLVGLHEQIRLQPHIAEALEAPVAALRAQPVARLGGGLPATVWHMARRMGQQLLTRNMLFITIPAGDLRLGHNVKPPVGAHKFPPSLVTIQNGRLRQLLERWDFSDETLTGTAAVNWARLDDRMHFIADFFRSHQQNEHLFQPPFVPVQVAGMQAGCIPGGVL
ncbi:MAG TPA: hypothetical protein PLD25_14930 [Chloroflexota bacterium]|nr:hypothetical protein [Chloroflexota bacterium]